MEKDVLGRLKEAHALRELAAVHGVAPAIKMRVPRIPCANNEDEPESGLRHCFPLLLIAVGAVALTACSKELHPLAVLQDVLLHILMPRGEA
jgi:hypothetical protein